MFLVNFFMFLDKIMKN